MGEDWLSDEEKSRSQLEFCDICCHVILGLWLYWGTFNCASSGRDVELKVCEGNNKVSDLNYLFRRCIWRGNSTLQWDVNAEWRSDSVGCLNYFIINPSLVCVGGWRELHPLAISWATCYSFSYPPTEWSSVSNFNQMNFRWNDEGFLD